MADVLDEPSQHAIKVLDEGGKLGKEAAETLASFVAGHYVRTPAFREQNHRVAERMRDSLIRGGVEPAVEPLPETHPETQRPRAVGGVRWDELMAMLHARPKRTPPRTTTIS